jgi:hypothetical protein
VTSALVVEPNVGAIREPSREGFVRKICVFIHLSKGLVMNLNVISYDGAGSKLNRRIASALRESGEAVVNGVHMVCEPFANQRERKTLKHSSDATPTYPLIGELATTSKFIPCKKCGKYGCKGH